MPVPRVEITSRHDLRTIAADTPAEPILRRLDEQVSAILAKAVIDLAEIERGAAKPATPLEMEREPDKHAFLMSRHTLLSLIRLQREGAVRNNELYELVDQFETLLLRPSLFLRDVSLEDLLEEMIRRGHSLPHPALRPDVLREQHARDAADETLATRRL